VVYAGSAPGAVSGAFQVNVEIPADAPSGTQPLVITVGSRNSPPGVTVAIQ
jgi:trimeric autotransporter adhesin